MSRLAALAGASILAITVASAAGATTITASAVGFSNGSFRVDITGPYTVAPPPSSPLRVNAGRLALTTGLGTIFAWCVDLYESLASGSTVYTLGTLASDLTTPPAPLTAAQIARVGGIAEDGDVALSSSPNAVVSAAYQAAIWKTIYGGSYAPVGTAAQNALFNTTLSSALSSTNNDTTGTLYQELSSGRPPGLLSQQLYGDDPDGVVEVPLPGALGLFGFALAGLVLAGRRKA